MFNVHSLLTTCSWFIYIIHLILCSWMVETVETYSPFILVQLVCLTVCIACIIFQFDLVINYQIFPLHTFDLAKLMFLYPFQQLQHMNVNMTIVVHAFFAISMTPFLYCYFGKSATDSYWQKLPIELQKYLILMIANMQRPLYYHGFGIAVLDLETFIKVKEWRKTFDNHGSLILFFIHPFPRYFALLSLIIWCLGL